jgi:hypothetical protein
MASAAYAGGGRRTGIGEVIPLVRGKEQQRDDHRSVCGDRHRERGREMAGLAIHSVIRRSTRLFGVIDL